MIKLINQIYNISKTPPSSVRWSSAFLQFPIHFLAMKISVVDIKYNGLYISRKTFYILYSDFA